MNSVTADPKSGWGWRRFTVSRLRNWSTVYYEACPEA